MHWAMRPLIRFEEGMVSQFLRLLNVDLLYVNPNIEGVVSTGIVLESFNSRQLPKIDDLSSWFQQLSVSRNFKLVPLV